MDLVVYCFKKIYLHIMFVEKIVEKQKKQHLYDWYFDQGTLCFSSYM